MKNQLIHWLKLILITSIRLLYITIIGLVLVSRNFMYGLDLDEIKKILELLNNGGGQGLQSTQDLMIYNIMYYLNENSSVILLGVLVFIIMFEFFMYKLKQIK